MMKIKLRTGPKKVITLEDDTSVSENGKTCETGDLEKQKKIEEINLEEKEIVTLEDDESVSEIGKECEIVTLEDHKKVEINLEDEKEPEETENSEDKPEIKEIVLEDNKKDEENQNRIQNGKEFVEISLEDEVEGTVDVMTVNDEVEQENETNKLCDKNQTEVTSMDIVEDSDFIDEETSDQVVAECGAGSKPPATGGLLFASWMISGDGDKDAGTEDEKETRKRKLVLPSSLAAKVARVEEEEEVLLLASPTRPTGCSLEETSC